MPRRLKLNVKLYGGPTAQQDHLDGILGKYNSLNFRYSYLNDNGDVAEKSSRLFSSIEFFNKNDYSLALEGEKCPYRFIINAVLVFGGARLKH